MASLDDCIHKPSETLKSNVLGTVNLLKLCKKYKIRRFIYASTVYANSGIGGFYGVSKRAAEDYIREFSKLYDLKFTIIRYGSLFGARSGYDNGLKKIILRAIKKKEIIYGGSAQTERRYIEVKDAAALTVNTLKNKFINKHVVILGKKIVRIKFLLKLIKQILKIKKNIHFQNNKLFGHYKKVPSEYKFEKEIQIYSKNTKNFNLIIKNFIRHIKENEI